MRLMLDTNIIVDILSARDGYEDSLQLLRYCELGEVEGFVSAVTVTNVMYILRKHIVPSQVRTAVQTLLLLIDVANVTKSDITSAFASEMRDYEDAVQSSCARRMGAKYIVTRNLKDFLKSQVPAISPLEALEILAAM